MANVIITFYSSSQTAAQKAVSLIKGIGGGVLHNFFYFILGIAYCGVHLFLNGFLKSPEKLIAEKYNYRNQISIQLDMPLFDIRYIKDKDILPCIGKMSLFK